jgi:hypothetical protein
MTPMPLLPPLNDTPCLDPAHQAAEQFAQTPEARAKAKQFRNRHQVARHIRSLPQRDDFGDPNDGPRIQCDVSQRLRLPADDPNCYERLPLYLALVSIVEPETCVTSATMMLDNGRHTFPVEFHDGIPEIVVLDPIDEPLHNAMTATAYQLRNASPMADTLLAPWFVGMTRNACMQVGALPCYRSAMHDIRRSLLTGLAFQDPETIDCVLDCAERDAHLFQPHGSRAFDRVYRSLRNLSVKLDRKRVAGFLNDIMRTAEPLASDAIKLALVSQFGPAAQVAFHGVDLAIESRAQADRRQRRQERAERIRQELDRKPRTVEATKAKRQRATHQDEHQSHLRRMTFASLQPSN